MGAEPPGTSSVRRVLIGSRGQPGGNGRRPRQATRLGPPLLPRRRGSAHSWPDAGGAVPRGLLQGGGSQQRRPTDAQPLVTSRSSHVQPLLADRYPVPSRRRDRLRAEPTRRPGSHHGVGRRRLHLRRRLPRGAESRRHAPSPGGLRHREQPIRDLGAAGPRSRRRSHRAGPRLRNALGGGGRQRCPRGVSSGV